VRCAPKPGTPLPILRDMSREVSPLPNKLVIMFLVVFRIWVRWCWCNFSVTVSFFSFIFIFYSLIVVSVYK
jgi:hypothetical protein